VAALVISGETPSIFADPFFAKVIVGVSAALEEADLHLMRCLAAADRGRRRLEKLLRAPDVDGVMLMAVRENDPVLHTGPRDGAHARRTHRRRETQPVDPAHPPGPALQHLTGYGRPGERTP